MKENRQFLIVLYVITLVYINLNVVQNQVCQSQCNSCGAGALWAYTYSNPSGNYLTCADCKPDSNRNSVTPSCMCDYGFYYDGTQCVAQKMGTIYLEDFESPTSLSDNWDKSNVVANHNGLRTTEPFSDSNVATFTQQKTGGDIFYAKFYQTLKYDERFYLSYDYKDESTDSKCDLGVGHNLMEQNVGYHQWLASTKPGYPYIQLDTTGQNWGHASIMIDQNLYYDAPFTIMFQNYGDQFETHKCFLDNVQISTPHGPDGVNVSAYHMLHPTFMILSVDYTSYDGTLNNQHFNFKISTIDRLLGRNDWNSEQFALYTEEHKEKIEVILYRSSVGGMFGDGYGEFVSNVGKTAKRWFNIGEHLLFDNLFAKNTVDFVLYDGVLNSVKDFDGPYKADQQNLANCFDDCKDYETFWEAARVCRQNTDCKGIKYGHKNWGGSKSQGFVQGFGYQLRKIGPESHVLDRKFEFSYIKSLAEPVKTIDCEENCEECGTQLIKENAYFVGKVKYKECIKCDMTDPNRLDQIPTCPCKTGYFYDGNLCMPHKSGIIYEDDFSNGDLSINWNGQSEHNFVMTPAFVSKDGNDECIQFQQAQGGGDIFFKKKYQTLKYDEKFWISFDILDLGTGSFYFGISSHFNGNHEWQYSTVSPQRYASVVPRTTKWDHFEAKIDFQYDVSFRCIFEEFTTVQQIFMDSFIQSSTHGPDIINQSPYLNVQPGIMILSNDYDGFDGTATDQQQFNFNIADLEAQIGRSLVNGEKFAGYIQSKKVTEQFQFFTSQNPGQSLGDGYGKFAGSASFNDQIYFTPGDWIILSKDFTSDKTNFVLQSGTCMYDGPFKGQDQDMEGCFQNCLDFETLEEAMQVCLQDNACEAVTYSHKYWGGTSSQGFQHGYGYQLRVTGITPDRLELERQFEHTWKKKTTITGKLQLSKDVQCTNCNIVACENCVTSVNNCLTCSNAGRENPPLCSCIAGTFDDNKAICKPCEHQCSKCVNTADTCTLCSDSTRDINDNCNCLPGTFNQGANPVCQSCTHPCQNCSNQSSECTSCVNLPFRQNNPPYCSCLDGYFENGSNECKKCDIKCKTCSGTSDNCDLCFDDTREIGTNCLCVEGFYDSNGFDSCQACDKQCSSCQNLPSNCLSCPSTRTNFPVCSCQFGYYESYEKECTKCQYPCLSCFSGDICNTCLDDKRLAPYCECKDGFYDAGQNLGCQLCDSKCISCSQNPNNCTSCQFAPGRSMISPNCGCQEDYYESDQKTCELCDGKCDQCSKLSSNCIKCRDPKLYAPLCEIELQGNLIIILPNGQQVVQQCNNQCLTCTQNPANCSECAYGINRRRDTPSCYCLPGFHDENGLLNDCLPCNQLCDNCLSSSQCLACKTGNNRQLDPYSGICECGKGFKENIKEKICQQCYTLQDACVLQCPDNTYQDEKLKQCIQNKEIIESKLPLIIIGGIFVLLMLIFSYFGSFLLINSQIRSNKYQFQNIQPNNNQLVNNNLQENNKNQLPENKA